MTLDYLQPAVDGAVLGDGGEVGTVFHLIGDDGGRGSVGINGLKLGLQKSQITPHVLGGTGRIKRIALYLIQGRLFFRFLLRFD